MQKLEILEPKGPMVLRTYDEIPKCPPKGVVVKTSYCGICHSDVHLWEDNIGYGSGDIILSELPHYDFPVVLGHEISGQVYSLGEEDDKDADDLKVGDNVLLFAWIGCRNCNLCIAGESNICTDTAFALGVGLHGGYGEYVVLENKRFAIKVPDSIPMDVACMLPCSGLTTYNAITKVKDVLDMNIKVKGKACLLIVGAGGLGMWCLQTARAVFGQTVKIVVADIGTDKLENAMDHGADDTVLWDSSLSEKEIIENTKAKGLDGGVDAAVDLVNSTATAPKAFGCLNKAGTLAVVGLFGGSFELPLPVVAMNAVSVRGVYTGTYQQLRDFVELISRIKARPPDITHCKLKDVPEILRKLKKGTIKGRVIVKY